ncbi:hypothetical protein DEO72_LG3g691 [Vigna unguiculata]|uniref:Uncharacterized protein n=1 Tax=Vigna unguiculata TaxID=3917 RepID=A0A4D6LCG7_VIGUN|nr:hypothetical protein DEO72_LG3g691 [Vigna unguiculata]
MVSKQILAYAGYFALKKKVVEVQAGVDASAGPGSGDAYAGLGASYGADAGAGAGCGDADAGTGPGCGVDAGAHCGAAASAVAHPKDEVGLHPSDEAVGKNPSQRMRASS